MRLPSLTGYFGLFLAALVAATIFPAQSEAILAYLIVGGHYSILALVTVASIGNILGSIINWILGRCFERFRSRRWFPISQGRLEKAQRWYRRYGKWSLLASWMPVIGDPITIVAGLLREPLSTFIILVSIAKVTRYAVLAIIVVRWTSI